MTTITSTSVRPERTGPFRDLRGTDQRTPIERRVASLMDLASNWSVLPADLRRQSVEGLLPYADTATVLDYLSEAAVYAEHAEQIRNGPDAFPAVAYDYLADVDVRGLTEAQQLTAASETADCMARDVLRRAVEADFALALTAGAA